MSIASMFFSKTNRRRPNNRFHPLEPCSAQFVYQGIILAGSPSETSFIILERWHWQLIAWEWIPATACVSLQKLGFFQCDFNVFLSSSFLQQSGGEQWVICKCEIDVSLDDGGYKVHCLDERKKHDRLVRDNIVCKGRLDVETLIKSVTCDWSFENISMRVEHSECRRRVWLKRTEKTSFCPTISLIACRFNHEILLNTHTHEPLIYYVNGDIILKQLSSKLSIGCSPFDTLSSCIAVGNVCLSLCYYISTHRFDGHRLQIVKRSDNDPCSVVSSPPSPRTTRSWCNQTRSTFSSIRYLINSIPEEECASSQGPSIFFEGSQIASMSVIIASFDLTNYVSILRGEFRTSARILKSIFFLASLGPSMKKISFIDHLASNPASRESFETCPFQSNRTIDHV